MMFSENSTQMGDFTIFGFTKDPVTFLQHRLADRLNIIPKTIDFGTAGQFFLYTSYGECAETEEAIAIKLGFLRSPTNSPLSTQQLLEQKIVRPASIEASKMRGNALIICFDKTEPLFSVFKTILGIHQLYYSISEGEIICSDRLKCIVALQDQIELNEDSVPMHFLFRSIPGDLTYYRNIKRMLPGQSIKYIDGKISITQAQDLNFIGEPIINQDLRPEDLLYEILYSVVGNYVT